MLYVMLGVLAAVLVVFGTLAVLLRRRSRPEESDRRFWLRALCLVLAIGGDSGTLVLAMFLLSPPTG